MNWRIAVAIVVAFVLGGATGGLIEHQRVQNRTKNEASKATTTTAPVLSGNWFGKNKATACPGLRSWSDAVAKVTYTPAGTGAWNATRATLLADSAAMSSAYRSLIPRAMPAAKIELQFMLTSEAKRQAALRSASSASAYAAATKALATSRERRNAETLIAALKACATA